MQVVAVASFQVAGGAADADEADHVVWQPDVGWSCPDTALGLPIAFFSDSQM